MTVCAPALSARSKPATMAEDTIQAFRQRVRLASAKRRGGERDARKKT